MMHQTEQQAKQPGLQKHHFQFKLFGHHKSFCIISYVDR